MTTVEMILEIRLLSEISNMYEKREWKIRQGGKEKKNGW